MPNFNEGFSVTVEEEPLTKEDIGIFKTNLVEALSKLERRYIDKALETEVVSIAQRELNKILPKKIINVTIEELQYD